jgi:tetratricopeptide (TPR) repeat protein
MREYPCPECGHNKAAHRPDGQGCSYQFWDDQSDVHQCECKIDYGIYNPQPFRPPVFVSSEKALNLTDEEAQAFLYEILGTRNNKKSSIKTETCLNNGVACYEKGDLDHAISDWDIAIQLNPNYGEACNSRGIAYAEKGDIDRAVSDFDKAIQLDTHSAEVYFNRGWAYYGRGNYDRAIDD